MTDTTSRRAISDKELTTAINSCAKEQIHIPGSIQPQGYMLILDENFVIKKISANCEMLLGMNVKALMNKPLCAFVEEAKVAELKSLIIEGALNPIRSTTLTFKPREQINSDQSFDAIVHKSGKHYVLELEPVTSSEHSLEKQGFYQEVMGFSVYLQRVQNPETLYDYLVNEIRRITGFARVKLYRFDENWNGKVIAESKQAHMPSYNGLSFPHADIPKQARHLYAKNYLRLIPDVNYEPIPILPHDKDEKGEPIDLSFSVIHSVSPVHLQYLQNMDVKASMSISIMQNDQLWGLIACHHDQPYHVPYSVRMAAELFGHTFSAFLSNLKQNEELSDEKQAESVLKELGAVLSPGANLMDALKSNHDTILQAVQADGVIVYLDGKHFAFGLIPEMSFCQNLIKWLEENYDDRIFTSNSIGRDTDLTVQGQSLASGVLAVPVSTKMTDYVMWFRQEETSKVTWAGKPEKNITPDKAGFRLTPRGSFERWQENVRGFSKDWTRRDVETASAIGKLLLTKRYEDTLRQKNENLDSILNNSSAVIYIIDTDHRIISMNDSAQHVLGLKSNDIIGKNYDNVFDEELSILTKTQLDDVIKQQRSSTFEQSFSHHQQQYHFISVNFPLYSSAGDVYAVCVMSTDISSIKQTEEKLLESNRELERMAYIASHDLQEPLRMIASFTDIIHKKHAKDFDSDSEKYMKFTFDATLRMKNLITDLLQYSKLSNEKSEVGLIDTQTECEQLMETYGLMYEDKRAIIHIADKMPKIYMLPQHFSCILQNFIGNGIKYCDEQRQPEIHVDCKSTPSFWQFSVKDNGIGISAEHFDKIFMIFQRLHRNDKFTGTGIGLALCKKIIEAYGGKVWLDSEEGKGTIFYFNIPKKLDSQFIEAKSA